MTKRNLKLFYSFNISSIAMIVFAPIFAAFWVYDSDPGALSITMSALCALYAVLLWAWLCLLVIKNWLIFYQYKWTQCVTQSKWQQIINPNVLTDKSLNWFIANHAKYGQFEYVSKRLGAIALCCVLITFPINMWTFSSHLQSLFVLVSVLGLNQSLSAPFAMLYTYCVWKTPSLDDAFAIHWESKMHAKILCALFGVAMISAPYYFFTRDGRSFFVSLLVISFMIFLMNFVSMYLVPIKCIRQNKVDMLSEISNHEHDVTLKKVLENETTLNLFMTHLFTEFSIHKTKKKQSILID